MKKILGILLFASSISLANAGFIGHQLDADFLFPNITTVADTMSTEEVGTGVEWTESYGMDQIDIGDEVITFSTAGTFSFSSANFIGWSFTDTDGTIDDIIGVSLDDASDNSFGISRVHYTTDSIFFNFEGLSIEGGDFNVTVNVEFDSTSAPEEPTTSVPEPSILFLFGFGLLGLVFSRRKLQN